MTPDDLLIQLRAHGCDAAVRCMETLHAEHPIDMKLFSSKLRGLITSAEALAACGGDNRNGLGMGTFFEVYSNPKSAHDKAYAWGRIPIDDPGDAVHSIVPVLTAARLDALAVTEGLQPDRFVLAPDHAYLVVGDQGPKLHPGDVRTAASVAVLSISPREMPLTTYVRRAHGVLAESDKVAVAATMTPVAVAMLRCLQQFEATGLAHRDIKPANMFVARRGGEQVVLLGDLGSVCRLDSPSRLDDWNNACNLSPEAVEAALSGRPVPAGSAEHRYAAGVCMWWMLRQTTRYRHRGAAGSLLNVAEAQRQHYCWHKPALVMDTPFESIMHALLGAEDRPTLAGAALQLHMSTLDPLPPGAAAADQLSKCTVQCPPGYARSDSFPNEELVHARYAELDLHRPGESGQLVVWLPKQHTMRLSYAILRTNGRMRVDSADGTCQLLNWPARVPDIQCQRCRDEQASIQPQNKVQAL